MAKVNPFRFSTKYQDEETDLVYYGYRYYSGSAGRWISRDPLGEKVSRSLYGFVDNNSGGSVDFLGLNVYKVIRVAKADACCATAHHRLIYGDDGNGGWYSIEVGGTTCCCGSIGNSGFTYRSGSGSALDYINAHEIGHGYVSMFGCQTHLDGKVVTDSDVDQQLAYFAQYVYAKQTWFYIFILHDCGTYANDFLQFAGQQQNTTHPVPSIPPIFWP